MKKTILLFVTTLFVLAAVFAAIPVQTAKADGPGGGYEDITPPFTTSGSYERIPADKFEGSVEANGMYLPKWDDLGAMQYHYEILQVTGSDYTTVKFIFKKWYFGWDGAIYRWTGTKWAKVYTTMELGVEDGPTYATANVSEGYYALLVWYSGVEKKR